MKILLQKLSILLISCVYIVSGQLGSVSRLPMAYLCKPGDQLQGKVKGKDMADGTKTTPNVDLFVSTTFQNVDFCTNQACNDKLEAGETDSFMCTNNGEKLCPADSLYREHCTPVERFLRTYKYDHFPACKTTRKTATDRFDLKCTQVIGAQAITPYRPYYMAPKMTPTGSHVTIGDICPYDKADVWCRKVEYTGSFAMDYILPMKTVTLNTDNPNGVDGSDPSWVECCNICWNTRGCTGYALPFEQKNAQDKTKECDLYDSKPMFTGIQGEPYINFNLDYTFIADHELWYRSNRLYPMTVGGHEIRYGSTHKVHPSDALLYPPQMPGSCDPNTIKCVQDHTGGTLTELVLENSTDCSKGWRLPSNAEATIYCTQWLQDDTFYMVEFTVGIDSETITVEYDSTTHELHSCKRSDKEQLISRRMVESNECHCRMTEQACPVEQPYPLVWRQRYTKTVRCHDPAHPLPSSTRLTMQHTTNGHAPPPGKKTTTPSPNLEGSPPDDFALSSNTLIAVAVSSAVIILVGLLGLFFCIKEERPTKLKEDHSMKGQDMPPSQPAKPVI